MLPVAFHRALGFSWLHYLLESLTAWMQWGCMFPMGRCVGLEHCGDSWWGRCKMAVRADWCHNLRPGRPLFENSWNSADGLISKRARIFKRTLTFSQEVLKEPPGVVLWILQMDVGSPPGGWSVVWSLDCHAKHTRMYSMMDTAWLTAVYHVGSVGVMQTDQGTKIHEISGVWGISTLNQLYLLTLLSLK